MLKQELMRSAVFALPSLIEQERIVTFLDRETAKTEMLIDKRQAVISHTMTKGLDPDVTMKDNEVEWLGKLPKHWTIPPLYARYCIEIGKMLDSNRIVGDNLLPYLRNADVQWELINFNNLLEMDIRASEWERYTVRPGDLLVCEGGDVGRSAVVKFDTPLVGFQKALHRIRPYTVQEIPKFMYYTLHFAANKSVFTAEGSQSTFVHLTCKKLRKYKFPKPPIREQQDIVAYLDLETMKIDKLIEKAK